ncbi:MAG: hypothetical protein A2Y22_07360 [Clostridiales bacterium GWD2_32_59]|nr:MAG: hypothetical protein A2Y22_07360 [Clostridiales bacterium GWD2_32_59]
MEIFVARQPIFDDKKNVIGYELLYRDSSNNEYIKTDDNKATAAVLANSFMEIGYDIMTNGNKAFVKFTEELISMGAPTLFSNELIVIEILQGIEPSDEHIKNCTELKKNGYTLVLDNFEYRDIKRYKELLCIVDIVKVDWRTNSKDERKKLVVDIKKINPKIIFLAEKIEIEDNYKEALRNGYTMFQGYFFSMPILVEGVRNTNNKLSYLQILNEICVPEPDFDRISEIIESDPTLTLQLLKLINSVAFRAIQRITSVREALVRLGMKEVRKWISVIMLREVSKELPIEVMRVSIVRAYFMESLADASELKSRKSEAFMFGLFSMIDVLFSFDRVELLKDIPINEDLKQGLMGAENDFTNLFNVILYYEKADWDNIEEYINLKGIKINPLALLNFYNKAINNADRLMKT